MDQGKANEPLSKLFKAAFSGTRAPLSPPTLSSHPALLLESFARLADLPTWSAAGDSNSGGYHDNGQQEIINGDQVRLHVAVMTLEEVLITLQI